jgi:nucleoside-diphosphate-sugar epimerase
MLGTIGSRHRRDIHKFVSNTYIISQEERILVTGANGFIGARVVQILCEYGFKNIRCFVRPSSRLSRLESVLSGSSAMNVELLKGDLLSRADCVRATDGVAVVLHLAAGMEKSFAGAFMNSALTTRNLMDAFLEHGRPKRFVNVSSFAVYSALGLKKNALLDETCPLEDSPQERCDAYGFGKLKQEELVRHYGEKYKLPSVILRPGAVFGPGKRELSGRVGIDTFGIFMHLGASNRLPLTFVDNCAEAIVLAGLIPGIDGEVFNVVDDELPRSREFLRGYRKKTGCFSISIPYPVTFAACLLWEKYANRSKYQLPPVFNRRRCAAEWRGHSYTNRKLKTRLGWQPRVNMDKALNLFFDQFNGHGG